MHFSPSNWNKLISGPRASSIPKSRPITSKQSSIFKLNDFINLKANSHKSFSSLSCLSSLHFKLSLFHSPHSISHKNVSHWAKDYRNTESYSRKIHDCALSARFCQQIGLVYPSLRDETETHKLYWRLLYVWLLAFLNLSHCLDPAICRFCNIFRETVVIYTLMTTDLFILHWELLLEFSFRLLEHLRSKSNQIGLNIL